MMHCNVCRKDIDNSMGFFAFFVGNTRTLAKGCDTVII